MGAWFQYVQAVGLLLVACFGAYIAYRQHRTAREKLLLDLFDRRMAVFNEMRRYQAKVTAGKPTKRDEDAFHAKLYDAEFLFGADVNHFLKELSDRPALIANLENAAKDVDDEEKKEELRKQLLELRREHSAFYDEMLKVFRPYLGFDHIQAARR